MGILVVESVSLAIEALTPLRLDLSATIAGARSMNDARARVREVRRRHGKSSAIGDSLFVPMVMGELAGQLMVYEHELGEDYLSKQRGRFALAHGEAQDAAAFLNKPWDEAIEWFRARGIMSEDELSRLLQDYADRAAEARKLMLRQVQERVYQLLTEALEQGGTFDQFARDLRQDATGLGITADDPAYLQTVFRTNVQSAYGAGRHRALDDPDVIEARPFRQIRTAGDGRVREDHAQADGLVYRADNPTMRGLKTPFGFNCRCAIVSLESYDGDVATAVPSGLLTEGFG